MAKRRKAKGVQKETLSRDDIEELALLRQSVENIEKNLETASRSRVEIHDKLEKLGQEMITANNNIKIASIQIEEMKPTVADYKKLRDNINGGVVVVGGIGAVIFTAIGFIFRDIWGWAVAHVKFS